MIFQPIPLSNSYVISPEPRKDERGFFARMFCLDELKNSNIDFEVKQINTSVTNKKGVIRGMHFQKAPMQEAKIVQCFKGKIYDVIVDLRDNSPTKYKWYGVELSEGNMKMIYIPKGFAHGFQTLSDNCQLYYIMSEFFSPNDATGVRWDDPKLNIKWPLDNPFLSEKDKSWELLK